MRKLVIDRIKYVKHGFIYLVILSLANCNMFQNEEKAYHDNGNLLFRVPLEEGKRHGTLYQYYDDRQLQLTSNWVYGVKDGLSKEFFPNGNLRVEGIYKNDVPIGTFRKYFKNGKLSAKFNFNEKGQYEGYYYEYFPDGKLRIEILYDKGKVLYSKLLTENGDLEGSFLTIEVKPQPEVDEYIVGERYSFAITLVHPGFEDSFIRVEVGELDKDKNLVSTDFEVVSDSLTAFYEVIPQKEGKQSISGFLQEMITKDKEVVGMYSFNFEFNAIKK
ncbi:hypothetical protein R9C00_09665 [Flammeovirgaceae bacterium SG7u.111]|nr:hypothetical protein [Flammeovirgaceae bacterium SG7u.132]WPO37717.1 hypothetical protein R9C00_09665 [Flammeovirgaceae bacterium SG7u.111]